MKFILGRKLESSQVFDKEGRVIPVTLVKTGPCVVTQVKTKDKDGYSAVQVGFEEKKKISKPLKGHLKGLGNFRVLKEFRVDEKEIKKYKRGQVLDISQFQVGDKVKVIGTSKGKGFQGVVKRHGFKGSPASHGHKDQLRMPGSIGSTFPQRVWKGKKMAGRMGGQRVTVKNLEIVELDKEKNILKIKGALPGAPNSLVLIESI